MYHIMIEVIQVKMTNYTIQSVLNREQLFFRSRILKQWLKHTHIGKYVYYHFNSMLFDIPRWTTKVANHSDMD